MLGVGFSGLGLSKLWKPCLELRVQRAAALSIVEHRNDELHLLACSRLASRSGRSSGLRIRIVGFRV